MTKPIWDRLREIAAQAERASQIALSEEAERQIKEYREAQIADPIDLIVRVPRPTAWQLQALRLIASGVVADDFRGPTNEWLAFLNATKPDRLAIVDEEYQGLASYVVQSSPAYTLNPLGLVVLADAES